jgi:hypothetical protein
MITSKQIVNLFEKYFDSKKVYNKDVPVYMNPSFDDLKEIVKVTKSSNPEARFIINSKTKAVYAWDSYIANHESIYELLHLDWYSRSNDTDVLFGMASIKSNKLVPNNSQLRDIFYYPLELIYDRKMSLASRKQHLIDFFKHDWTFANNYIVGFNNYFSYVKQEYDKEFKVL